MRFFFCPSQHFGKVFVRLISQRKTFKLQSFNLQTLQLSIAKKLLGQTVLYGLSSIVGRALNYLLVPLHTAVFATAAYGVITELYAYVAFFNVLATYGLETAFFRYANRAGTNRLHLYRSSLTLLLITSTAITLLLALFSGQIANLLDYPGKAHYIVWLAIIIGVDALMALPFARLRLEDKAAKFATVRIANILINAGLNLFFLWICPQAISGDGWQWLRPLAEAVYNPELGVGYVFLSNLIANLLFVQMLWAQLKDFRWRFDASLAGQLLKYGYPLMIMGLAGMINEVLNRPMLKELLPENFYPGKTSLDALGIFGACAKLAIFMSLVIQAFRYAAEPFFFSQAEDKNSPQTFALVMRWFVICCAFILLFITANIDIFQYFLAGEDYREGLVVVPILLLANLFLGVYYNLSVWFKLTDRTYYGTYISIGGAVITILLNILLIPVIGYVGCAVAALACYSAMAIACYALGAKHYPIPYPVKAMAGYVVLALFLGFAAWFVPIESQWLGYGFHNVLVLVFIAIVAFAEEPIRQRLKR